MVRHIVLYPGHGIFGQNAVSIARNLAGLLSIPVAKVIREREQNIKEVA